METVKIQKKAIDKQEATITQQDEVIKIQKEQIEQEKKSADNTLIFGISSNALLLLLLLL